jgi:hypothetical protein
MKTKLQAWRSLPPEDRGSLARAWAYLLVAKAALPVLPLPQVETLLERLPGGSSDGLETLPTERLVSLVDVAARHHLRPMTCLPRSLALKALLRRQGVEADLRIGVRRDDGRLLAHAWIEQAGAPIGEAGGVGNRFTPLVRAGSCT